jgi:hypothetical protein
MRVSKVEEEDGGELISGGNTIAVVVVDTASLDADASDDVMVDAWHKSSVRY